MNRVIHFEIHAGDPERAARFYGDVFGWKIEEYRLPGVEIEDENRYWTVITGPEGEPGINGGLMFRRGRPAPAGGQAVNAYICTLDVAEIDDSLARVQKAGGKIALGKMAVPGIGWLAYCTDTEGNTFGMMQEDESAR